MVEVRARSNTELADAAFEIYRHHFPTLFTIAAVSMLPYTIEAILQAQKGAEQTLSTSIIFLSITSLILTIFGSGAIISIASDAYLSNNQADLDFESAFRRVLARPAQLVIATALKWLFIFLGMFFLFVPGVFMIKRYFSVPATVILEELGVSDGLKRSVALSQGNGRRILSLFFIMWIIYLVILVAAFAFTSVITKNAVVSALIQLVIGSAMYPLIDIITTLLYYDLRIRDEGFDIELMERDLDSGFQGQLVS